MDDNDDIFDIGTNDANGTNFADQLAAERAELFDLDAAEFGNKGDPYELFSKVIDQDRERDPLEYTPKPIDGGDQLMLDTDYNTSTRPRSGKSIRERITTINDPLHRKKAEQEAVALFTACGITQATQAQLLGMSLPNLRAVYGRELTFGKDMLISRVANALVQKALDGNVPAAQFILKTRGGWKETTTLEFSSDVEISDIEREQRLMRIMLRNPSIQAMLEENRRLAQIVDVEPIENEENDENDGNDEDEENIY